MENVIIVAKKRLGEHGKANIGIREENKTRTK
jgi:hypothetical protein